MADVGQIFQAVVDKKPADYAQGFDGVMKDKINQLVQDRKVVLATSLFGAPEGLEQEDETPNDAEEASNQEGDDNNGEESEENPEG